MAILGSIMAILRLFVKPKIYKYTSYSSYLRTHTYLDTIRTAKKHKYTLTFSNIAEMAILGSKMVIFGSFRMWIKNYENWYGLS